MLEEVLNTPAFRLHLNNVLCHFKHMMWYFEFLDGSRIICFPLNIPKKFHWQHLFEKPEEAETHHLYLRQCNTIPTHPEGQHLSLKQTNENHHHFFIWIPILYLATSKSILLTKTYTLVDEWNWFGCFSWIYFLSTLFQHRTNLLGWQDSERAV